MRYQGPNSLTEVDVKTYYYTTMYSKAEGHVIRCANEKFKAGFKNESNQQKLTWKKRGPSKDKLQHSAAKITLTDQFSS